MKIIPFKTEYFFAQYEFKTPYQLCNSDCETITVDELLKIADVPMDELGRLSLGYSETLGLPALREAVAESYARMDVDDVVMLATPVEGIYLVAHAALDPGDEVIVLSPAYDALINTFEHVVGASSVHKWEFGLSEDNTRWDLDFDQLHKLLSLKTKMLVVNYPHNPTG